MTARPPARRRWAIYLAVVFGATLLLMAGLSIAMGAPQDGRRTEVGEPVGGGITIRLVGRNGSAVLGSATFTGNGTRTLVAVRVEGGEPGLPVYIQRGPCIGPTAPAYPLTSAFPGRATTTVVDASLAELTGGGYAISVRRRAADLASLTDASSALACAEILIASMPQQVGIGDSASVAVPPRTGTGASPALPADRRGTVMLALGFLAVILGGVALLPRRAGGWR